ncbi:MAG TPA: hypothetical protein VJ846_07695 [Sphingomicrobium sp.]|nr:hypothetical protein [Sphingomicrobium sp.]
MLRLLFPPQFDNVFSGQRISLWILAPVLLFRTMIGINSMAVPRLVASRADSIPLDSFGPTAATSVIQMFAHLGLFYLAVSLLGWLALVRYRSMVPLIYLLIVVEQVGNKLLQLLYGNPVHGSTTTGALIVRGILVLAVTGLVLSLIKRRGVASELAMNRDFS